MNNIVLIGFRGVGKSTVGRALSEYLSRPFTDLDEEIKKTTNSTTLVDYVATNGEEEFRKIETRCLADYFKNHAKNSILSCGGGALDSKTSQNILKQQTGIVIHLFCDFETVEKRLKQDKDNPRISGLLEGEALKKLWSRRREIFDQMSDYNVNAGRTVDEIIIEITTIMGKNA